MGKNSSNGPSGVRGPGGPPPPSPRPTPKSSPSKAATRKPAKPGDRSASRASLERRSFPMLLTLQRAPKWLVVVVMASCLFLGLIQSGGLCWLGGILLVVVAVFLGWLLALSWPLLTFGSRVLRVVVVAAVLGIAVLKFMGRV